MSNNMKLSDTDIQLLREALLHYRDTVPSVVDVTAINWLLERLRRHIEVDLYPFEDLSEQVGDV
jgi:hypothetical protein